MAIGIALFALAVSIAVLCAFLRYREKLTDEMILSLTRLQIYSEGI